jgi:hypothetical protein
MIFNSPRTDCSARHRLRFVIAPIIIAISLPACAAKETPLAIRMYNPNTNQTLHCTGRDQTGNYTKVLANAVEACARELEARGFVRD